MDEGDIEQIKKTFGKVIKDLRTERDISQLELAGRGDFNRTYISDLERGKKQASLSTILRLSNAFEIKPSKLIELFEIEKTTHKDTMSGENQ